MSHHTLQRVVFRMLYDPTFAQRVHDGEDIPVTPTERAWLLATDPRAWSVDHQRPTRTLHELSTEFPVSCALVVGTTRRVDTLRAFFRSPQFHQTVQNRGSLDEGFAAYLGSLDLQVPQLPGLLAVEAAKARCRRELELSPARLDQASEGDIWRSRGVGALQVDASTLDAMNRVEELLFELTLMPAAGLASDGPPLPDLPPLAKEPDHLVLRPAEGDIALARLGRVVCRTLMALERPAPLESFAALSGLPEHVVPQLLADLSRSSLVAQG
jgi:hypothetical protein